MRFAIKHLPTNKFLHEDEMGTSLIEEQEIIEKWTLKETADLVLDYLMKCPDGMVFTDDGEYHVSEFEVVVM